MPSALIVGNCWGLTTLPCCHACRVVQAGAAATWEALHALTAGHEAQLQQQPAQCLSLAVSLGNLAPVAPAPIAGSRDLITLLKAALQGMPQVRTGFSPQLAC